MREGDSFWGHSVFLLKQAQLINSSVLQCFLSIIVSPFDPQSQASFFSIIFLSHERPHRAKAHALRTNTSQMFTISFLFFLSLSLSLSLSFARSRSLTFSNTHTCTLAHTLTQTYSHFLAILHLLFFRALSPSPISSIQLTFLLSHLVHTHSLIHFLSFYIQLFLILSLAFSHSLWRVLTFFSFSSSSYPPPLKLEAKNSD